MAVVAQVSLVGAGPGDPELLTRRAVARLRAADLILYDALVDERVLRIAKRARRFFVGKRAGRHAMAQDAINALMIRAARRGRRVVRLKGGDPFVFGRGAEEVLALRHAGITCEVVPGISNAIAAPSAAGIPVTHRGLANAFLVVSGHDEAVFAETIHGLVPERTTVVVLMGLGRTASMAWTFVNGGWRRSTPVAIVTNASLPDQQVWRGTLDELADGAALDGVDRSAPGTIVVGEVVALMKDAALEAAACGG